MMQTKRLSDHNMDRLIDRAGDYHRAGWEVKEPIYVDWFWRGYSIIMEKEVPNGSENS